MAAGGVDGEETSHRDHQHVHLADSLDLRVGEQVPEVAAVADFHAVNIEAEDDIRPPLAPPASSWAVQRP